MSRLVTVSGAVEDRFTHLADDVDVPANGAVTVSIERWEQQSAQLGLRADPVGVRLPNTFSLTEASEHLLARPLIVLNFPGFADGRAYSQARLLRQRHHYAGELRAQGEAVVVDQVGAMFRCGIDSFELRTDQDTHRAITALQGNRPVYQAAVTDPGPTVRRQRREQTIA